MSRNPVLRPYAQMRDFVTWPVLAVGGLTATSLVAVKLHIIPWPYVSTYVAAVAIVASRVCVRAGLMATGMSAPVYNFLFAGGPHQGFVVPDGGEVTAYIAMIAAALAVAPRRPSNPEDRKREYDAGTELPFTRRDHPDKTDRSLHGAGVVYWDVKSSGDWAQDCAIGGEYARIFVDRVRRGESRPLMAWIVRDMVRAGKWSGIETGFMQGVARPSAAAIRASPEAPPQ